MLSRDGSGDELVAAITCAADGCFRTSGARTVVRETTLPIGADIWAAVEKAPGFTPEGMIAEIRRNAHYPAEEWRRLASSEPIDPVATMARLRTALDAADAFVREMPTDKIGLLFLEGDKVVQPDPQRLDTYTPHAGSRRGHWPSSPEIATAMMERFKPS